MKQKLKYFILISFAIFLEYFRDYLFININLQINFLEDLSNELSTLNYTDSSLLYLIKSLEIGDFKYFKMGTISFFCISIFWNWFFILKVVFSHKNHIFFTKLFFLRGPYSYVFKFFNLCSWKVSNIRKSNELLQCFYRA